MNSKKLVLSALTIALLATSGLSFSREASEGPRGDDRVHTGTHKNGIDTDSMILARRGADDAPGDDRGGDRVRVMEDVTDMVIARRGRGADDAPGDDRGGRNA